MKKITVSFEDSFGDYCEKAGITCSCGAQLAGQPMPAAHKGECKALRALVDWRQATQALYTLLRFKEVLPVEVTTS